MKGLLMMLGKPKGGPTHDEDKPGPMGSGASGGAEQDYAREAFSALKEDDEDGFVEAFLGAVKACVGKAKGGAYEADDDEEA